MYPYVGRSTTSQYINQNARPLSNGLLILKADKGSDRVCDRIIAWTFRSPVNPFRGSPPKSKSFPGIGWCIPHFLYGGIYATSFIPRRSRGSPDHNRTVVYNTLHCTAWITTATSIGIWINFDLLVAAANAHSMSFRM